MMRQYLNLLNPIVKSIKTMSSIMEQYPGILFLYRLETLRHMTNLNFNKKDMGHSLNLTCNIRVLFYNRQGNDMNISENSDRGHCHFLNSTSDIPPSLDYRKSTLARGSRWTIGSPHYVTANGVRNGLPPPPPPCHPCRGLNPDPQTQGGLAHLPKNLFVYISVCTPRGSSKLTPKVPILIAEFI